MRQQSIDEIDVSRHPFRLDQTGGGIDADGLIEMSEIDFRASWSSAVAKQVGGTLVLSDRGPRAGGRSGKLGQPPRILVGDSCAHTNDEVDDATSTCFERGRVRRNYVGKLIASRMFECADRKQLVILARDLAEVGFENADFRVQTAARDVCAQLRDLLGSDVDSRTERAVMLPSMEEQATPTAADVNERFARLELNLATDVVEFVALSLLERAG